LVKTRKFKNSKYVGDPINALKIFNEKGADEIVFLDIGLSKSGKSIDFSYVLDLVSECFIPFAYGGGVSSLENIRKLLNTGVEKVIINNYALKNPGFVNEATKEFGSSSIIGSMDVKKNIWGKYRIYDHVSQKNTNNDPVEYAKKLESLGVGELFVNFVDGDGTYEGLNSILTKDLSSQLSIPLVACGGAKDLNDMAKLIYEGGASAVAAGSLFVYQKPNNAVLISYPERKELEKLFNNGGNG
jgi:cyclase